MRHLGSFVLSLVLAPLIYLLAGVGLVKFAEANEGDAGLDFVPAATALVALLLAGAFYAILAMARLSPLGPMTAGLALLAVGFWVLIDPEALGDLIPADVLGVENAAVIPAGGMTVLLSVPLLATVASARRWRRYDRLTSSDYGAGYAAAAGAGATVPGFPQTPSAPLAYPTTYPGQSEPATHAYSYGGTGSPSYGGPGSPAYGGPGSPAYGGPGSPAYLPGGSGSPAYPQNGPASPAYPPPAAETPAYPFPSPVSPTWPRSYDQADTSEQTRPIPAPPQPESAPPATHPPQSGYPTPPPDETTRRL